MGIFVVDDAYVDAGTGSTNWVGHVMVPIGNLRLLALTSDHPRPATATLRHTAMGAGPMGAGTQLGPQARVYTLTDTGWTRSTPAALTYLAPLDPAPLPPRVQPFWIDVFQACAATLEGNVLVQSNFYNGGTGLYKVIQVHGNTVIGDDYDADNLVPYNPAEATHGGGFTTTADGMSRVPLTNTFLTWRYDSAYDVLFLDYLRVTSAKYPNRLSTFNVPTFGEYGVPDIPRKIIIISSTEAIAAMQSPTTGKLRLIHIAMTGVAATATTQDVTGYLYTDDFTLIPSTAHHAEFFIRNATGTDTALLRFGVDFIAGSFALTAMPLTQLAKGLAPDDYEKRTTTAHVVAAAGAQYVVNDGAIYVARQFRDDGSNDNWVLLTQYDQTSGVIMTNIWAKGDQNGSANDTLVITDMHLAYETTSDRLVLSLIERFIDGDDPYASAHTSARVAVFRASYTLGVSLLSQRVSFDA